MSPYTRIRRYLLTGALMVGCVLLAGSILAYWQGAENSRYRDRGAQYHLGTIRQASLVQEALFQLESQITAIGRLGRRGATVPRGAERAKPFANSTFGRVLRAIDSAVARIDALQRRFADAEPAATVERIKRQWSVLRAALAGAAGQDADFDRIKTLASDLILSVRRLEGQHWTASAAAQDAAAQHATMTVGLFLSLGAVIALVGTVLVVFFYRQIGHTLDRLQEAEAKLRRSEAEFAHAQRIARLGSYEWDTARDQLCWSDQTYRIFGLAPGEITANVEDFVARIHPDDRDRVWADVEAALHEGAPYDTRFRIVRADGTVRHLHDEGEVVRDPDGRAVLMRGAVLDITETSEAQEALRLSEARLVDAQRIAKLGNWNWNVVTDELHWSDQIYRIFGLEPREFGATYEAFLRSVHPDDREAVQEAVNRALRERQPYAIRHRILWPDGSERIVHEQGEATFDDDGTPLRMAGTVQDITDLARAERELAEKSRMLDGLVQNSVAIIAIKDPDGRYVLVNPEFERALGVTAEDALGKTADEVFPDSTAALWSRQDRCALEDGSVRVYENRVLLNDGSNHVYLAAKFPIRSDGGKVQALATIATDITERKRAEEAMRRSEERFRDFAEGANDWVWEMDADLRYTYLSPSYEQYSGIPVAAVLGRTRREVYADVLPSFSPDEVERWHELNRLLETRQTFRNFEHRWVKPNGEERSRLTTGKPVFDAQGTFQGYRGVGSDITSVKRREEEIRKELERLVDERTAELRAAQEELVRKERLAALGQLTGTVSHELRNPLGSLRASVASMRKLTRDDQPMLRRTIEIIDRNITRCDNIIGDLLDYSRGETLERESTDVGSWLEALLDEYASPAGVVVHRDIAADVGAAFDRERLRRVVVNLLDNACQAMTQAPAGEAPFAGTLSVSARRSGDRVRIEVADSGPGIAADDLERIFEPLFSTKSFGVGLGLPIVRRIMASHGGGVEVDSAPGRGARFVLWLPWAQELRRTAS